jgi:hypothetical protein
VSQDHDLRQPGVGYTFDHIRQLVKHHDYH